MADTGIKELLEAGVHFGHQTRRWDPSMRRYIHGERDGIHIIDLLQTEQLLKQATDFCAEIAGRGGKVLLVGTKKQARDTIEEWAEKTGMPYVSRRWLGGLLTNFQTINKRIKRLHELTELETGGQLALLPTKERMAREAELKKLEFNLGGVRDMERTPDAVFVIDLNAEEIAVNEARRLDLPIVALVDTNCNPRPVEFVIPGNDDAIRSCDLIVSTLGGAILESATAWQAAEEARRKREEEERKKREAEMLKKRQEEEERKAAAAEEAEAKQNRAEAAAKQEAEKKAKEEAAKPKAEKPKAEKAKAEKPEAPAEPDAAAPEAEAPAEPESDAAEAEAAPAEPEPVAAGAEEGESK
ncbi:MAG TPA: 30S ribosomal protein S2 [Solirubrobacterales bacterium]|nr:30S ribosomal protein S2 [Solirubrobacterales bacterium]